MPSFQKYPIVYTHESYSVCEVTTNGMDFSMKESLGTILKVGYKNLKKKEILNEHSSIGGKSC